MLHPLEHIRDHQNPLADTPALAPCPAPQLRPPQGCRCASALKSIPFHAGATTSFIGFSCRCSRAGMPTIIERDVRPMKIALEFPTCQRRRAQRPRPIPRTVLSITLGKGEDLCRPLGRLLERRLVLAVAERHEPRPRPGI